MIERAGADLDEDVAGADRRVGDVAVGELVEAAVLGERQGLHARELGLGTAVGVRAVIA